MLSFMVLVVVHSSQLYRKIHSANTLKWRIFCDKVRYLLLYTWLFSFMVGEGGGHSRIPRHVRAPYYWRHRVISGLGTV